MRYSRSGTYQDGAGNVLSGGTVSVYLAGTSTPVNIYTASSGGIAVNSVTTASNGGYSFYVDAADYVSTQKFDITLTKSNYSTAYLYNVTIYPVTIFTIGTLANSATPAVDTTSKYWLTGGTTTITNITGGAEGQEITILSEHAITITDGTNIFLSGSTNFVMASTDSLSLVRKADGKWYEIGRSDNT